MKDHILPRNEPHRTYCGHSTHYQDVYALVFDEVTDRFLERLTTCRHCAREYRKDENLQNPLPAVIL